MTVAAASTTGSTAVADVTTVKLTTSVNTNATRTQVVNLSLSVVIRKVNKR